MLISDRLKMVVGCAKNCDLLVDVGTDHAYIPIFLVENKIAKRAIACDISKGSIEKADKNIRLHNYTDFIETRVGDGLKVIKQDEIPDQIIIAGMGGMLTIDILNNSKDVVRLADRLILQPQRDIDKVRRTVHKLGFKIIDEKMLFEDGKYYNVIVSEKGQDLPYSDEDYFFGKILLQNKDEILNRQVEFEYNKIKRVISEMQEKANDGKNEQQFLGRLAELKEKKVCYEKVLF